MDIEVGERGEHALFMGAGEDVLHQGIVADVVWSQE